MPNRALIYHDESDVRTRDSCCPPLTHCLIRPPNPADDRLLLFNPFKYPERQRDPANARALWRKRFGSASPDPGKILIPDERLATPHDDEVEFAEWTAMQGVERVGDDPAALREIERLTGIATGAVLLDTSSTMGGEAASALAAWAKSLTESQIDRIKEILRLGQKWTLRKIQKEEDPDKRRALAAAKSPLRLMPRRSS